jgi:hypothetical protein
VAPKPDFPEAGTAMLRCPKCSQTYTDAGKICRSCGAILDKVPDDTTSVVPLRTASEMEAIAAQVLDEAVFNPDSISERQTSANSASEEVTIPVEWLMEVSRRSEEQNSAAHWVCPRCGENVPRNFDVCWNCRGDRQGRPEANTQPESSAPALHKCSSLRDALQHEKSPEVRQLKCAVCGSSKIIPSVTVVDQGQMSSGFLQVVVYGDPDALLFKNGHYRQLMADICGECGHAALRVPNPQQLYEHYLESRR